ncbi:hypothetical protein BDV12DRAFT_197322 [Aspergillus spectabilis]
MHLIPVGLFALAAQLALVLAQPMLDSQAPNAMAVEMSPEQLLKADMTLSNGRMHQEEKRQGTPTSTTSTTTLTQTTHTTHGHTPTPGEYGNYGGYGHYGSYGNYGEYEPDVVRETMESDNTV